MVEYFEVLQDFKVLKEKVVSYTEEKEQNRSAHKIISLKEKERLRVTFGLYKNGEMRLHARANAFNFIHNSFWSDGSQTEAAGLAEEDEHLVDSDDDVVIVEPPASFTKRKKPPENSELCTIKKMKSRTKPTVSNKRVYSQRGERKDEDLNNKKFHMMWLLEEWELFRRSYLVPKARRLHVHVC